jgi:selenide,water dikinase
VLDSTGYEEMMASVTLLNRIGAELGKDEAVHAITDVTGFGILGHALEMARGSKVGIALRYSELPLLGQAARLAEEGFITGASTRNWASYGDEVHFVDHTPLWKQQLLTDPQTSGGLLVSCAPDAAERIFATIHSAGYPAARVIGAVGEAPSVVTVVD